ncbi:hypothetical protein D3C76_1397800 [compost metagenome]
MSEKPWQWLIDDLTEELKFWQEHGLDKEQPETFSRIQTNLELAHKKQETALKGKGEEA